MSDFKGVPTLYLNPCKDCGKPYAKFVTQVQEEGKPKKYKILCQECSEKYVHNYK